MSYAIYDSTLGSLTLRQCTAAGFNLNGEPVEGTFSGQLDVAEYFGGQCDLRATFETEDIAAVAAVSNILTAGLSVSSGTITVPWQKRQALGTFASGSSHLSLSSANGLIIPNRIELPNGGNATVGLEVIFVSADGTTVPVAVNTSQALSSQAFNALYTLGPVVVNGTTIDEDVGVTITPGLTVETKHYNGVNFLLGNGVKIVRRRPMIEIRSEDLAVLSSLGAAWGVGSSIVVYARKRSGASFVADGTAQHVKITGADGLIRPQTISASGGGSATRSIIFYPESITLAGSQAIS